jgi:hypothetical protein
MAHAVYWNLLAFSAMALLVIWLRYRLERLRQQVDEAHATRAIAGGSR